MVIINNMRYIEVAYDILSAPDLNAAWNSFSSRLETLGLPIASLAHCAHNNSRLPGIQNIFLTTNATKYYLPLFEAAGECPFDLYSAVLKEGKSRYIDVETEIIRNNSNGTNLVYQYLLDIDIKVLYLMPVFHNSDDTFAMMSLTHNYPKELAKIINQQNLELGITYASEALLVRKLKDAQLHKPILSRREIDCLAWYNLGFSAYEIGYKLNISVHTVNEYFRSARGKLKTGTTVLASTRALLLNLYQP